MKALDRIQSNLNLGVGMLGGLRLPGPYGATGPWPGFSVYNRFAGTEIDWRLEAGNLWDNSTISILLHWKWSAFAEPRWITRRPNSTGQSDEVPGHGLTNIISNPCPGIYDTSTLLDGIILSLDLDGNAYMLKLYSGAGKLSGLLYIPHMFIEPAWYSQESWIDYYAYRIPGQQMVPIPKEKIVHLKTGINPQNQRKGHSRLAAVIREVVGVNGCATYGAVILRNLGLPGLLLSPKATDPAVLKQITPEKAEAFKQKIIERFSRDRMFEPMVQTMPMDVTTLGFSPEQMVLEKLRNIPTQVICAAGNVDAMVLGLPSSDRTYSNFPEANQAAYEQCVKPDLKRIDDQLTAQLGPEIIAMRPGDYLSHDYTGVLALQENQDQLWRRTCSAYRNGVIKRKTALRILGLEFDDKIDDVYFTDITVTRTEDLSEGNEPPIEPAKVRAAAARKWFEALVKENSNGNGHNQNNVFSVVR